jgi:hypothetical protein
MEMSIIQLSFTAWQDSFLYFIYLHLIDSSPMKYSTPYLLFEAYGCLTLVSVCPHRDLDEKKPYFNVPLPWSLWKHFECNEANHNCRYSWTGIRYMRDSYAASQTSGGGLHAILPSILARAVTCISRYRFRICAGVLTIQAHTPVIFLTPLSASCWMDTGRSFLWWISRLVKFPRYLVPRWTSGAISLLSLCAFMIQYIEGLYVRQRGLM